MHNLKSGPCHLPRRVVATADRVYATLSIQGPVNVLDAKTGEILSVIAGTEGAEEIVMENDALYIVCDKAEKKAELARPPFSLNKVQVRPKDILKVEIASLNATTGEKEWQFIAGGRVDSSPTLYKQRCYFGSADGFIYCLDLADGGLIWKYQGAPSPSRQCCGLRNSRKRLPWHS
jgi:outer membrane protein assembly factor BamB